MSHRSVLILLLPFDDLYRFVRLALIGPWPSVFIRLLSCLSSFSRFTFWADFVDLLWADQPRDSRPDQLIQSVGGAVFRPLALKLAIKWRIWYVKFFQWCWSFIGTVGVGQNVDKWWKRRDGGFTGTLFWFVVSKHESRTSCFFDSLPDWTDNLFWTARTSNWVEKHASAREFDHDAGWVSLILAVEMLDGRPIVCMSRRERHSLGFSTFQGNDLLFERKP